MYMHALTREESGQKQYTVLQNTSLKNITIVFINSLRMLHNVPLLQACNKLCNTFNWTYTTSSIFSHLDYSTVYI